MRQLMPMPEKRTKPQLPADRVKVFTEAGRNFPGDFAKQAQHIVAAHRPAGLPEHFQPLNMGFSWDQLQREQQRFRQEAEAHAREQLQAELKEQQRRAGTTEEHRRLEEKLREAEARGRQSCQQLEQELRSVHIDQLAEDLASKWRSIVPVSVTMVREPQNARKKPGEGKRARRKEAGDNAFSDDHRQQIANANLRRWARYHADKAQAQTATTPDQP